MEACNCSGSEGRARRLRASPLAIDHFEIARFLASGILATIANLAAMSLAKAHVGFNLAAAIGLGVGFVASFLLSKLFTFRAAGWDVAHAQIGRFAIIYALGATLAWCVAVATGAWIFPSLLRPTYAAFAASLTGAATMALTSYVGHRSFTFARS